MSGLAALPVAGHQWSASDQPRAVTGIPRISVMLVVNYIFHVRVVAHETVHSAGVRGRYSLLDVSVVGSCGTSGGGGRD